MSNDSLSPWRQSHDFRPAHEGAAEKRLAWVITITLVTMLAELIGGYAFGSMALVADGWHMGSHAAALSISAPSRPFNLAIDGLIFTLIDHALFGLIEWCLTSLSSFAPARWLRALGETIQTSPSLPGELGRQFSEAGGFPIILIAIGVGLVFGVTRHHGWDFRLLRKLKLTNRTGENLVWAEALTAASQTSYAMVACRDG